MWCVPDASTLISNVSNVRTVLNKDFDPYSILLQVAANQEQLAKQQNQTAHNITEIVVALKRQESTIRNLADRITELEQNEISFLANRSSKPPG